MPNDVPATAPPPAECSDSWGAVGAVVNAVDARQAAATDLCRPGAIRPASPPTACTTWVDAARLGDAVNRAEPGDRVCARGRTTSRLTVRRAGTPKAPIQVLGTGDTTVGGITVEADHVLVDGFTVPNAPAPAVELRGDDITVRNNVVTRPTGGDRDGIRFFGTNLRILHNTVSDVRNEEGAHADCMQTYATNTPPSRNVLIHSNRCERIDNQCLIAEGPNSRAGDGGGKGRSSSITFTNNFCDTGASQAVMIDNVQDVTVTRNQVVGANDKAFAFDNRSTGAQVRDNTVARGISYEVGMDDTSRPGYRGPKVGGAPWKPPLG